VSAVASGGALHAPEPAPNGAGHRRRAGVAVDAAGVDDVAGPPAEHAAVTGDDEAEAVGGVEGLAGRVRECQFARAQGVNRTRLAIVREGPGRPGGSN
jgi:hypothetical protein